MTRFAERRPRPWTEMISAWEALIGALCAVLGLPTRAREAEVSTLHIDTWRWMLSLPPCSEGRKAALTLGYAAMMIERWRAATDAANRGLDDGSVIRVADAMVAIGQRAESLLRIAAWHIDDARIERASLVHAPGMARHVRVYAYSRPVDHERGGVNFCGVMNQSDRRRVTLAMLDDFVRHASERKPLKPDDDALIALAPALVETLGVSLPEGPWLVTSQDVWRFLEELLVEDT